MVLQKKTADAATGSPPVGGPEYLVVGFIRRPHGIKGEVLMEVHTDFPERIKVNTTVFVSDEYKPVVIASRRRHAKGLIIRFRGIKNPEQAGLYRNTWVYVPTADRPALPEGEYYHHQLIGLNVITDKGQNLGMLVNVMETGANDVYSVQDANGNEILLPAIPSVVLDIDLVERQMHVHLLDGLF